MIDRIYYTDSYLREFPASIVGRSEDGLTVYLDRTAFYPESGGQPADAGAIAGVAVVDVVDEGERVAHRLLAPLDLGPVECAIDWPRRFDHMQQHTGQHLLSAAFEDLLSLRTVSFHLGAESATIDLEGGAADAAALHKVERRANEIVFENRPVSVLFEDVAQARGLRKPSDREGTLRIISIDGFDRSACGGTHVRATGQIGVILLRKVEKVRQTTRVEFLCGGRGPALARRRTTHALRRLLTLGARAARVIRTGVEVEVPLDQVVVGDRVVVRAGETFPVDGIVVSGTTWADESALTGESRPVAKEPGASVAAGTLNGAGLVTFEARRVGDQTLLARVASLVAAALEAKAPAQELVDRISALFLPAVVLVALATFAGWYWVVLDGQFFVVDKAILAAVSVLLSPVSPP